MVLFSNGTYAFDEIGDFHFPYHEEDHGKITLTWDFSMDDDARLSRTYDLNTLNLRWLFEYVPEGFMEQDNIPDPPANLVKPAQ